MRTLLAIALLISLATCKKEKGVAMEPCPCEGVSCVEDMMAFTYFLPGTWWVYEEEDSGLRDSVYVYYSNYSEGSDGSHHFSVKMHSTYDGYNYYHSFNETINSVGISRPDCDVQHMYRTKTMPGDYVGYGPVFFVPFILDDYRYSGGADEFLSIDSLFHGADLTIQRVYYDVDVCGSEEFTHAGFHMTRNIGITKKSQYEEDMYWNLIDYDIVQ